MSDAANDFFYTVEGAIRASEYKVLGSRFIADIVPVETKDQVEETLTAVRKEFYDASHHCFAYRIGPYAELVRAADDGEPTGTAGKPILLVLTGAQLTNTLIVVTRYFGGTKLGTGGLARAYAEAAQRAVQAATRRTVYLTTSVTLGVPYDDLAHVERLIRAADGRVLGADYQDTILLVAEVRKSKLAPLLDRLRDDLSGRIGIVEQ